jgi:uncharacterized small protein (DUF1192 family)
MDIDDLEPKKRKPEARNLDPMSVEELREYIVELRAEIMRVEANLTSKTAHLTAAAGLFKTN